MPVAQHPRFVGKVAAYFLVAALAVSGCTGGGTDARREAPVASGSLTAPSAPVMVAAVQAHIRAALPIDRYIFAADPLDRGQHTHLLSHNDLLRNRQFLDPVALRRSDVRATG